MLGGFGGRDGWWGGREGWCDEVGGDEAASVDCASVLRFSMLSLASMAAIRASVLMREKKAVHPSQ